MTHLRQRMIEDMGICNLADHTQSAYLQQVIAYAGYFHRSPEELGLEAVRTYQLYLTNTRRLSPSSISFATSALRFLYKVTLKLDWAVDQIPIPKRPFRLQVILSPEEFMHFLDSVDSLKHRSILMTANAAGLRVSEAIHLKVDPFSFRSTASPSASQWPLPDTTQESDCGCWLGFSTVVISNFRISCARKVQRSHFRRYGKGNGGAPLPSCD